MKTKLLSFFFSVFMIIVADNAQASTRPSCESVLLSHSVSVADSLTTTKSVKTRRPVHHQAARTEINLIGVDEKQWKSVGQEYLAKIGPLVGIEDGVSRGIVRNQREGEDCWACTISGLIETQFRKTGDSIKLSPEHMQIWHIYDQIQAHLSTFKSLSTRVKNNPSDKKTQALIKKILETYGVDVRNNALKFVDPRGDAPEKDQLYVPDVGNEAALALKEVGKYGIVPYQIFKAPIKTEDQETRLEKEISNIVGKIIADDIHGKVGIDQYKEGKDGAINGNLAKLLDETLGPIYGAKIVRPQDQWSYMGKSYSSLSLLAEVKERGLDVVNGLRPFVANEKTHDQIVEAVVAALLIQDFPVAIGIPIVADPIVGQKKDSFRFAEESGVFTNDVCPDGKCQKEDGGHEIKIVNFIAQSVDPSITSLHGLSRAHILDLVKSKKLIVTGFIIQNSWGSNVGLDVNGKIAKDVFHGGYFVITTSYLLSTGLAPIADFYDIVLPSDIAEQYPGFEVEEPEE